MALHVEPLSGGSINIIAVEFIKLLKLIKENLIRSFEQFFSTAFLRGHPTFAELFFALTTPALPLDKGLSGPREELRAEKYFGYTSYSILVQCDSYTLHMNIKTTMNTQFIFPTTRTLSGTQNFPGEKEKLYNISL